MELKDLYEIEVQDDGSFKGGVEDLGNFKEGFCLLLKGRNRAQKFKWVICAEDPNEKYEMLRKIVILRMRIQCNKLFKLFKFFKFF